MQWILLLQEFDITIKDKKDTKNFVADHLSRLTTDSKSHDVHHGNYNPSCKAKSNMQEDLDGPMTRARAKQLQRALTSQIGMIEAASELKN